MIRRPAVPWRSIIGKPTLAIGSACLLLMLYIGFLAASNYRSQLAIYRSNLKGFQLDVEKRAASLGYFFSERKYDLRSMAASTDVVTYFINKSLGMSEHYGLKVNLFVIDRLFRKTLHEKSIQGDPIYARFLLVDRDGTPLVDNVADQRHFGAIPSPEKWAKQGDDPSVMIDPSGEKARILLNAPCMLKKDVKGHLFAWLNLKTLHKNFIGDSNAFKAKGFELVSDEGCVLCPELQRSVLPPDMVSETNSQPFSRVSGSPDAAGGRELLAVRVGVHNTPLDLIAWLEKTAAFGSFAHWQLLVGTGSLALVIVLGVAVLMRFKTQNALLESQFQESERQQALLARKHRQLKKETEKRRAAELELETQRTISMRSDRLRSLGEMAAGIAHELNQPLTGVRGLAEVLLLHMEAQRAVPPEILRKKIGRIIEQADRMVHIINHIRMFAREAGKLETREVDLNEVARSGIGLIEAQLKSNGFFLEKTFLPKPLTVNVNPYSVEEVIFNLINNARDAVEKKKEQAESDYRPHLAISTWAERNGVGDQVFLKISDNGDGIPHDIANKVFDPFFTSKAPDKGTGLGLSICKSIVEEFGGRIHFESTENKGTDFIIRFPSCANRKERSRV